MKAILIAIGAIFITMPLVAQNKFIAYLKDGKSHEAIIGATAIISGSSNGAVTDLTGLVVLESVPNGRQIIMFKALGYETMSDTLFFPVSTRDTIRVYLNAEENEMEEVQISTTRSSRTIRDIPTRIEFLGAEEVGEKANMKPGDIRMMLSESTGIQTLQTSAISGNSSIRIEGLDGRYCQILKDGFPLYAGFSGGLGLLQTPPLDLKQVEIIKGSSSTLYGGGAIAGLINLISKTPTTERELRFLLNGTSAGGLDLNSFYSKRFGRVGVTIYTAFNSNAPYDPAGIGLTAIPKFERFTLNPRMFFYLDKSTDFTFGLNTNIENRIGGDMQYINGNRDSAHNFYENNKSQRFSSQLELKHRFSDARQISFKNSVSFFSRKIDAPGYMFEGSQVSSFTEISYNVHQSNHEWVGGANVVTDAFMEKRLSAFPLRDYKQVTVGGFIQNTCDISSHFIAESGIRSDYVFDYGFAILPRISVLYKINNHLTSRLGGGLGYNAPTIFTEESERMQYRNILPVSKGGGRLEESYGGNWDVNYRTTIADGKITFSLNQLLFYTRLNNPLMLLVISNGLLGFGNLPAHIDARGAETNMKIGYRHFRLYLGYTYTHSHLHYGKIEAETPLTPQHHTNSVLTYEVENKWKIGLEAYYYSPQVLSTGKYGRDYWLCGFMAEKLWKKCSVFINFENFLDSRQTRFGSIYSGTSVNPVFKEIYAPLDGFVFNGGLKFNL